jgi:hypothetical protein
MGLAPDYQNENTGQDDAYNEDPNTKMQDYWVPGSSYAISLSPSGNTAWITSPRHQPV